MIAICLALVLTLVLVPAVFSDEPGSQLGRVKIAEFEFGKTVVSADGKLMRGSSVFAYKWGRVSGKTKHIHDDSFWQMLEDNSVNAIRLVCFDPCQQSHGAAGTTKPYPYADLDNAEDVAAMLADFDQVIDSAGKHNMYVLLNYHNTGGYRDPNFEIPAEESTKFKYLDTTNYITKFWNIVAPRYKDRTHVFYELMNEPVQWWPENYTEQVLSDIKKLFDQVRADAPKTHLVLVSTANHMTWKPEQASLLKVAQQLKAKGVDFSNASIGLHAYNSKYPEPNQVGPILETMKEFAVINTEANLPKEMNETKNDPDGSGFNGDQFGVQSMERLKISWFHWKVDTPELFKKNWNGLLLKDAKKKGYFWK